MWALQGTACPFWAAPGARTWSLCFLFNGCLCHLFQLAWKVRESEAEHTKLMFILNQVHTDTDPKKQKGEGSTQKVQTPAPPQSTAQSCCEGHTCAMKAGVISTSLRPFPEKGTAFHSPPTLMLGCVGLFCFLNHFPQGFQTKYVIHLEHLAKRTRCAFKEPQHVLKHWNKPWKCSADCTLYSFSVNLNNRGVNKEVSFLWSEVQSYFKVNRKGTEHPRQGSNILFCIHIVWRFL